MDSTRKITWRFHLAGRESEQVMSDEWRARRRLQEKRAGRWIDGTIRIDKLWEAFHWVLEDDKFEDKTWGRIITKRR